MIYSIFGNLIILVYFNTRLKIIKVEKQINNIGILVFPNSIGGSYEQKYK